jgi:phage/plasmid-associated DNA primase
VVVPQDIDKEAAFVVRTVCPEAVLKWVVEGYIMYREMKKLPSSTKTKEATNAFNSNLTDIGAFLEECIEKHEHMESKKISDWKFLPEWCVKPVSLYTAFDAVESRKLQARSDSQ